MTIRRVCDWSATAVSMIVAGLLVSGCGPDSPAFGPATPTGVVRLGGAVFETAGARLGGVVVTGYVETQILATTTRGDGSYELGPFNVGRTTTIVVTLRKPGYISRRFEVAPTDSRRPFNMIMPTANGLPVDGSVAALLLLSDPSQWVQEDSDDYEGDVSWNTKYFTFTTPATADLDAVLEWEHAGNAALMLWVMNDTLKSRPSGAGQALRLPRGVSGVLLVGQSYEAGELTEPVSFTLTTTSAGQ